MLSMSPAHVYVTTDALKSPSGAATVRRICEAISSAEPEIVTEEQLAQIVPERDWGRFPAWGMVPPQERRDPELVLTTGKFGLSPEQMKKRAEALPQLRVNDLLGHDFFWFRPDGEPWWRKQRGGVICQSAYQLHSITGCPFRCDYCGMGNVIRMLVNVDEYVEQLDGWMDIAGEQRLFKWDNRSDVSCFEPEYGLSARLVDFFARKPDRYLEIYIGKSDNCEHLLNLDHRGKTILQWSIGPHTQCEQMEERTASMDQRIEAGRRCREAGYIVRYRFSPLVPVRNWREECSDLIEKLCTRAQPDIISLCAFGWMSHDAARQRMKMDLFDPQFVAAMEAVAPFIGERDVRCGAQTIPFEARYVMFQHCLQEIRRVRPETHVALCLEPGEMWAAFHGRLRGGPEGYVCNCGGHCAPGNPMYDAAVSTVFRPVT